MKRLLLLAAFGAALTGCAGDAVKLKQDHSYVVEWIGERPLMDYAHLTVTLGAMVAPTAMAAATTGLRRTRWRVKRSPSARSAAPASSAPRP